MILTVLTSLCARVLKARYFKNFDIMHAGCQGVAHSLGVAFYMGGIS
jgi:hypothetical protein